MQVCSLVNREIMYNPFCPFTATMPNVKLHSVTQLTVSHLYVSLSLSIPVFIFSSLQFFFFFTPITYVLEHVY